jgi:hypothetical protein
MLYFFAQLRQWHQGKTSSDYFLAAEMATWVLRWSKLRKNEKRDTTLHRTEPQAQASFMLGDWKGVRL